ncbi:1-acyl-sn-glycerol-3-phosphate acyltransferase [Sutterella sp.]|uniref:lysophospholipid acyltransferase family protein n=1 Tax=Sutterella sp. TaxID=1981025 RepID=UPI0026DEBC80|nr:lysophospholipid acyltransferase family protein [Sutterella sp.]MDO5530667.1 lysophospholipid acyltransferase family protein [Sutterella sp.]
MRYVVGTFRLILLFFLAILIFLVAVGLFPVLQHRTRAWYVKHLAPWITAVIGVRVTVKGSVPDPSAAAGIRDRGPGYLVSANHISFLDIFILDSILPVRFIAKKEIGSWPVFGPITTHVGTIYIDRSRKRAVLEVAEAMAAALREGTNVLFFPEGTTGPGDKLLPFYANLFAGAEPAGAEILPVTIRYTVNGETSTLASYAHETLGTVLKRVIFTPGVGAEVTILDPIPSVGRDRRELAAEASRVMAGALGWADATAEKERARSDRMRASGIRSADGETKTEEKPAEKTEAPAAEKPAETPAEQTPAA